MPEKEGRGRNLRRNGKMEKDGREVFKRLWQLKVTRGKRKLWGLKGVRERKIGVSEEKRT